MKIIITLFLSFYSLITFSQEKYDEPLYIYVRNSDFWPELLAYKAVFGIKSKDKRFQSDNYYFKISYHDIDYQSLYSLGTPINKDGINYIKKPDKYFKDYSNCELHNMFSLYKRIYIVTDIPKHKLAKEKDKSKTYIMFYASYAGTQKNIVYTNVTGRDFIDD